MATELKPMDDIQLTAVVRGLLRDAEDYAEELGDMREATTSAYNGDGYGNEQEGRSQIVTREVRDAVEVAKPGIMRTLFGSHSIVEYAAQQPEDVPYAKDATAWARYVVYHQNRGYMEFLSAVDDALIRKTGVLKLWWETDETPVQTELSDLTEEDLQLLASDDEITAVEATENGNTYMPPPQPPQPGMPPMQPEPEPLFDAVVTRIETKGRLRFQAVPPEELVVDRNARNFQEARLVGHRRNVTLSDLMVMGYEWEEIEDLAGGPEEDFETEEEARSVGNTTDEMEEASGDPTQREVVYAECWVRVDADGDGIAELRRICVAGSGYKILSNELADFAQMVDLCPSPVAHQAIGHSLAELVEDIQKLKTMIMRNTMDSLANAIHPDVEAVEGQVNFDDLLNTEQGRIVRVKQPGMLRYLQQPFVGREVFPIMQYLDTLAEARTGMNEAAQGLNADALQSTSTAAIQNAAMSANGRIEHIARNFVEGGLTDFFKMLLKLARSNADRSQWVRLNNRFIDVDPRVWKHDMDVVTTVALGTGTMEQRLAVLRELAAKQEQIIQLAGPDNPLAGIEEYRNTLAEIAKLSGIVDVERYLKDPTDPANQPQPQPPQPPSPEELLARSELQKTQQDGVNKTREYELDVWKAIQEDDRERDKMMGDLLLRAEKLRQEGVNVNIAQLKAEIERDRESHQYLHNMLQDLNQARQAAAAQQQQPTSPQPQAGGPGRSM